MEVPRLMLFLILLSTASGIVDGFVMASGTNLLPGAQTYDLETVEMSEDTISAFDPGDADSAEQITLKQNTAYTVLKSGLSGLVYFKGKLDKVLINLFGLDADDVSAATWLIQAPIYYYYGWFLFQIFYRKNVDDGV